MKSYRVIIIGPTGVGKSQFCNFVIRDSKNNINKVSDSLSLCTQDPFSNYFTRNNTNYEFIDTPGSVDNWNDDKNLEKLVYYLKIKKEIHYIILLFRFNERIRRETRNYIETLGKIFTPGEFYTHLCVFFTKFPNQPTKKENKKRTKSIEEINEILKETFNLQKNEKIPNVNVYFIDTEYDEDENSFTYDEKGQDTIDIMMKQMKLDVDMYHSINTTNIDMTGVNAKIRAENNRKEILNLLEEEKRKREREEAEKRRLEEEIRWQKKNGEERRRKEKEIEELIKKQSEEKKRLEEIARENKRKEEENEKKRKLIEEEARKEKESQNCLLF